jgi:hypothetical protein
MIFPPKLLKTTSGHVTYIQIVLAMKPKKCKGEFRELSASVTG